MSTRERPPGCCPPRAVRPLRTRDQQALLGAFRALADPNRLQILRLIAAQRGPVCVCDIVDHFELSQPTVSHHLAVLRDAGLLRSSRVGIWSFWEIDPASAGLARRVGELLEPALEKTPEETRA